jgi:tRNA threonylcarbamoyladenosine biosynthesis protein TsaB
MIVLALETSTACGSVALLDGDRLLLDEGFTADRSQSSELFPLLERALALAPRIDRIAVGLGPGSYAGARIAIASALGLGVARSAELVGLPSVAALETAATRYVAIGDARRETFYFTQVEDGECIEGPVLLTAEELRARLDGLGDWPVYAAAAVPGVPEVVVAVPQAARLARLAAVGRGIVMRGDLEPLYLREAHITTPKARGK